MEELVSICVPVYNTEKYIDDCINSILKQSYNNIEILFNDDGSIDNSYKILSNYCKNDSRIHIYRSKNSGPAGARNLLIDNSNGKYILFIDSDDVVDRDYVLDFVKSVKYGVMAICGMSVDYINEGHSVKTNFTNGKLNNLSEKIFYLDKLGLLYSPCNKLYDKEILDAYKLRFNENLKNCEDLDFNVRYFKYIKDISIISKSNYHYRKFGVISDVNSYREDIVNITLNGINLKNDLYNYFKLEEKQQQLFLLGTNIDVLNYCIINSITYETKRNRKDIYEIIKFVFGETSKFKYINDFVPNNLFQKIFILCYKTKNITFTFLLYKTLLFFRYRLKTLYSFVRKLVLK